MLNILLSATDPKNPFYEEDRQHLIFKMGSFLYYFFLIVIAVFMFLQGFFPMQSNQLTDPIHKPEILNDYNFDVSQLYKQDIDRLILVVVDALRMNFITEENMPFLTSTQVWEGCTLTVKVESPTVTLPRIKALTTGGIPQFIDVILNLASTKTLDDSLMHRAADAGKKIVFYGDDTWMKLYPRVFDRYEGVSSFFVNDYTEVDNNVTRNVMKELNQNDWDIMVLHYLGLDHIGHVYGPYSHLIQVKLKEMDGIIEKIFSSSKTWNKKTMIAITGDHGMKESGGHGGSTSYETHVPFVSLGIPCRNDSVAQTDLPATLASLMGLTIPTSSVGRIISNLLRGLSLDRVLYILRYNTLQLYTKINVYEDVFQRASELHYRYLRTNIEKLGKEAKFLYEECAHQMSTILVHSSVQQNINNLLVSTMVLGCCLCEFFQEILTESYPKGKYFEKVSLIVILLLQFGFSNLLYLTVTNLIVLTVILLKNLVALMKICKKWRPNGNSLIFFICGSVAHLFSLLSSSFIEEEHQTWYFYWGTFLLLESYNTVREFKMIRWVLLFVGLRVLRTLNQTGDKWAHLPDLAHWLLLEENYIYLQVLLCVSLIFILIACYLFLKEGNVIMLIPPAVILFLLYIFHTFYPQNALLGKLIWLSIFLNLFLSIALDIKYLENVIVTWVLLCALLLRTYNVILLPACIFASRIIHRNVENITVLTIAHIWLGRMLFFCQGHSNSLAAVDIASGYVGLQEYIPIVVILQVLCHTYAFPILCNLLMLRNSFSSANRIWIINAASRVSILITTCVLVLLQRHHLFVWTVFAPKLLIEACNTTVLFIQTFIFYCIISIRYFFIKC